MATEAARLVIRIESNADKAARDMGKLNQNTKQGQQDAKGLRKAWQSFKALGIAAAAIQAARGLIELGRVTVQAASDAEETANRFNTVFRDISGDSQAAAENLSESFGLSRQAAQDLLASTGDLLTGFGFTQEAALDLSDQANQLAIDLASFTNVPIEQSSRAITSALTGETEALKSLGIVVRQGTADFRNQVEAVQEATGATESQARAQVILQTAIDQSGNAIGDFERSQDSLANTQRTTQAALEDLSTTIGNSIIPAATEAQRIIGKLAREIDNLLTFDQQVEALNESFLNAGASFAELERQFGSLGNVPTERLADLRSELESTQALQQEFVDQLKEEQEETGRLNFRRRRLLELTESRLEATTALIDGLDIELETYDQIQQESADTAAAEEERLRLQEEQQALLEDQLSLTQQIDEALLEYASEQEQQVASVQREIDALVELRTQARELGVEYQALQDQINALVAERDALIESYEDEQEVAEGVSDVKAALDEAEDAALKYGRAIKDAEVATKEFNENSTKEIEEFAMTAEEIFKTIGDTYIGILDAINDVQSNRADAEIQRLEAEVEATEEGTQARADAEERLEKAKKKAAREEAQRKKAIGLFTVAIETAQNIAEVFPNPLLIAAATALGIAQAAVIASQPIPGAEMGGSYMVDPGNERDGGLLKVSSGERVDVTPARQSGSGSQQVVILQIDRRELGRAVTEAFDAGQAQIRRQAAIRTR